jgi:predicted AlkP superfamily pyrophosphatase or phosphodiesterase
MSGISAGRYTEGSMKRALLFLGFACALAAADRNRHVIVISLDGFPAYTLNDPGVPFPVLRRLMAEGASAQSMTPVNPTVTWPNHTAIISGVNAASHGVIYNGMPVRPGAGKALKVEPWVPKTELVQARTVYDAAHDAGLTTAEVDWVAIYKPPTVDWSFAEQPGADGKIEKEMLESGEITRDVLNNWRSSNILLHDEYWTRAAVHIIEKHKPNLLMYHLLTTDSVQHQTGAKTLASNTALVLADRQVQRILDAVDRAGIRDTTTIFIVSDHGFKAYHHTIRPNALLKEKGLLRTAEDCDGWVIPEGGTAKVYVTREEKRNQVLDAFRAPIPGVAQVIAPADYEKWGFPKVAPNGRMSDLVLVAANDYAFDGGVEGPVNADVPGNGIRGAHGYPNTDPELQAILVAWGAGIKAGVKTAPKPNVDVAATIAQLLGVEFQAIQGKPLTEFLK